MTAEGFEGQRVLVTGGSSGIGFELARLFAENGHDVIIAANDIDKLEQAAELLRDRTQVDIQTIAADLATEEGVYQLHRDLKQPIDILCTNAGVGSGGGEFTETDLKKELELVDLNVRGLVQISKLVIRDMVERGEGGKILFTASIAGLMPGPFESVYAASKSFVRSFGEALRNELASRNIDVTVLMPGPTETDFFHRAGMDNTPAGQMDKDDPTLVARQGYEALMADKHAVIGGGLRNKLEAGTINLFSDPVKARAHRSQTEPVDYYGESEAGISPAAIGGLFFAGALAAAGTAVWLQSRRDEDVERGAKRRIEPKAEFEVGDRS